MAQLKDSVVTGSLRVTDSMNASKINGIPGNVIPFIIGTGTTAGTWTGTLDGLTAYYDGLTILYKSPVAGASTTTLNLNNIGARTCYVNSGTKLTTHFPANQPIFLVYSASQNSGCWMCLDDYWTDSNTYTQALCATEANTAAKVASMTYYTATAKSYVMVNFRYANSKASALTLNINSQGAKPIYINGTASSSSNYTLPAASYLAYYDGTNYYLRTDGLITGTTTGNGSKSSAVTASTTTTWNGSGPYTQSLAVSGVTASNNIIVGLASTATAEQMNSAMAGKILCTAQASGSITLTAYGAKPTVAIPFTIIIAG